jgi:agmatinase
MLIDGDHPIHWINPCAAHLADIGNFTIALGDIAKSSAAIEEQAAGIPHLVALGGDHGITRPLLRALARKSEPPALIHFDAHVDTWPENFGQTDAHGCVFYRAISEGLVAPRRMIQIGVRSPVERAVHDWTIAQGVVMIAAQDVHEQGPTAIAERIRQVVGEAPVYLSFDIDVLDPAFAPGTGTPEIGGLASWQAQAIMRGLRGLRFVGMDLVEVCPPYDVAEITALAGATIAWEYLCLLALSGVF